MSEKIIHTGVLGMRWGTRRLRSAKKHVERDIKSLNKYGFKKEAKALKGNLKKIETDIKNLEVMKLKYKNLSPLQKSVVNGKELLKIGLIATSAVLVVDAIRR